MNSFFKFIRVLKIIIFELGINFIKEFFNDEDSEPIQQDDFLSKFFEEVDEAGEDLAPSKDVVAEHFASVEEQPLQEKDFLSEFFAELEADQPTK